MPVRDHRDGRQALFVHFFQHFSQIIFRGDDLYLGIHDLFNDDGIVEKANLIVSTTNNNQAMNESIRKVASQYLDGNKLSEALLNQVEVAIRAYDPCLSCATHAMGKMPLQINLVNTRGELLDRVEKRANGSFECGS